jgi:hypothetical protein
MFRWRIAALVVFLLSLSASFAQVTGRISGAVIDPSGAAIPNAKVSVLLPGGQTPLLSTETNSEGIFDFSAVRPDLYNLAVDAAGFLKFTLSDLKVDASKHVALPAIRLGLQSSTQTVEVSANTASVDMASAEIATTVSANQIANLPVLDRQISNLFATQAGVAQNGRTATVINGLRPSYANLTLDGINIQDSVRTNNMDYLPNKLTIGQVAEFTVSTSNANPTIGGAASTVALVTPSGGNSLHGSGYWYNRNNFFSANDWYSNMNSVARPFLNLNQVGGSVGGPVIKDRLFFFSNYEAYRQKRQMPVTNTILTPTARQGILQYKVGGAVQQFDVLKAAGVSMNSATKALLDGTPTVANNLGVGDGLNTTGYTFNARNNETRDNLTFKGDFNLSPKNVFSGSYIWNRDIVDRPGYTPFYTAIPPIYNDNHGKLVSGSWRSTPTAAFTNELRGGFNFIPGTFKNRQNQPSYFITGLMFSSPIESSEVSESRDVKTYSVQDNANWVHGRHSLSFGYQMGLLHNTSVGANGTIPSYGVGISAASTYGFNSSQITGASSTDLSRANSLLASLGGLLSTGTQTFNATGRTSGFVSGAPSVNAMTFDQYAFYLLDNFKIRRNLTLTLGLRYDYMAPVDETDTLAITPKLIDNNIVATALGNAQLDLTGNAAGRPFYNKDRNNFAPNIAIAWDVKGDGKTSVRAGFNIAYLNDNAQNSIYNVFAANSGLSTARSISNLTALANTPPSIPTPPFAIPTTTLDQYNLSPSSPPVEAMIDPNLRTPYAEQWNLSVQHDFKGWIVEGRYVANHAVKMFREIDFNQIQINQPGFLADFQRARSNMFLANAAGKGFVATYDPSIAGSQQLTYLPSLYPTAVTNSTLAGYIRSGEIGTYAQTIQGAVPYPKGVSFFPNPYLLYSAVMTNLGNSSYQSAQFEVRKRIRNGMQFQANYTFGKALTDSLGLRGLDAQLDNANPRIERARADFDLTHSIKLNHYVPLPFGKNQKFDLRNAVLNKIAGGWGLSGFMVLQSGNPVSILSARGTLNRGARSGQNTVDVTSTREQLAALTGTFKMGNGVYWMNPSNIASNTQGVSPDGTAPFAGQMFENPQAGSVGNLQRRSLDGPWNKSYNFSLSKEIQFTERHKLEFHAEIFNILNHPNFYISDQNVNSNNFGRFSGQNYSNDGVGPRLMQFGLYYKF